MFTRLVLPALALGLAAPISAVAAPVAAQTSVAVRYADLDLTKAAGRDMLEQRLERAVRNVCGDRPVRDLRAMDGYNACIASARASYQSQVELALNNANARRVAVLADKLAVFAGL